MKTNQLFHNISYCCIQLVLYYSLANYDERSNPKVIGTF